MDDGLIPTHVAGTEECLLAENPLWDARRECVFWSDINAGKIYKFDPANERLETVYSGETVGGFTLQENGDLLLFRVKDIALLGARGEVRKVREFSDTGMSRFNDVIADPRGRVFAGTIGSHPEAALYRMDLDGSLAKLFAGTGCSNGMGFSPDLKKFYWTSTTTREIFEFDFDVESGEIFNRKVFHSTTPEEGLPDGLTIDSEGCLWSARWGSASLVRYSSEGKILQEVKFPAVNVTSACFGGKNLDELFVTSAKDTDNPDPHLRGLFRLRTGCPGEEEFRSNIQTR